LVEPKQVILKIFRLWWRCCGICLKSDEPPIIDSCLGRVSGAWH
jgi:hypothetical protein